MLTYHTKYRQIIDNNAIDLSLTLECLQKCASVAKEE